MDTNVALTRHRGRPTPSITDGKKICSRCKHSLSLDKFATSNRQKSGYWPFCKECDRSRQRAKVRKNRNANPVYRENRNRLMRSHNATRRSGNRSPLSKFYKEQINEFYQNTPEGKVVDHIIPLRSANVCGLHTPWNLQYLNPEDNRAKGNRWDGTYENSNWINYPESRMKRSKI